MCSTAGLLTSSLSCSLPIPKNSDVLARKFSFFRGPRGFLILGERRKCGDSKLSGCEVLVTSHFRRRHSSASVQDSHLFPFSSGTNEYPHQTPLLLIRAQRYYFFFTYASVHALLCTRTLIFVNYSTCQFFYIRNRWQGILSRHRYQPYRLLSAIHQPL